MQTTLNQKKAKKAQASQATALAVFQPRPHQAQSVKDHTAGLRKGYTLPSGRKVNARLDGSDMGTGKTYIALFVARAMGLPVFVVCPQTSIAVWNKAIREVGVKAEIHVGNYETYIRSTTPYFKCVERIQAEREHADAVAIYEAKCLEAGDQAYQILRPKRRIVEDNSFEVHIPRNTLIIIDESHRCKGLDSQTAELMLGIARLNQKDPLAYPVLALSATAATSPADMKALGLLLGIHEGDDFESWARMNGCATSAWGKLEYLGGAEGLLGLHKKIFPKHGSRIRIQDLPKGMFPETIITSEAYDMGADSNKIQKVYDDMERELDNFMNGKSTSKGMSPLTIILRARQKVELLKVPAFVEMAKDANASGHRCLIFVNFKETLYALQDRLKTQCVFHGENRSTRNEWLKRFQANDPVCKNMILNVAAGAESISCQDLDGRYPRFSIISPNWSAFKMHQCFGRTHRDGGESTSVQRLVYAARTIEQRVSEKVKWKLNNLSALNDGDFMSDHMQNFLQAGGKAKLKKEDLKAYTMMIDEVLGANSEE